MNYQFDWSVLWQYRQLLIDGLWTTILLFLSGAAASLVIGCIVGVCGASCRPALTAFAEAYVEINRNTPLVVKLFFLYFGFGLSEFTAAVLGLTLHQSAYKAEVIRAGIQSIPKGQTEAGLSTGLSRIKVMLRIILPQAFVIILPPLTTQIMETLKNTSVAMTISIEELTFQTQQIEATTFRGFEAATATTVLYLLLVWSIGGVALLLERHFGRRGIIAGTRAATIAPAAAA